MSMVAKRSGWHLVAYAGRLELLQFGGVVTADGCHLCCCLALTWGSLRILPSDCLCSPAGDVATLGNLPPAVSLTSVAIAPALESVPVTVQSRPTPQAGVSVASGGPAVSAVATAQQTTQAAVSQPPSLLPPLASGLILSPAMAPIPHRLVQRIQAGRFVEMRELLTDNLALHDQLEAVQGLPGMIALPATLRTRQREVTSLTSWMYSFSAYMAVRTTDEFTRNMLTYCRLIIHEALRHGGQGWIEYDRTFRRLCEVDATLPWNSLLPDLQASTILSQRQPAGLFCVLCRGVDHSRQQCSLSSIRPPPINPGPFPVRDQRRPQTQRRTGQFTPICSSWNTGSCAYPGSCTFRHVCARCFGDHMAMDCADDTGSPSSQAPARRNQGPSGWR